MNKADKTISLAELQASLADNSDYTAGKERKEREQSEIVARYLEASRPLCDELRRLFPNVDSPWKLATLADPYPEAIPILLAHLPLDYPPLIREGIVAALKKKWARQLIWQDIIAAYAAEPNRARKVPQGEVGAPSGPKDAMADLIADLSVKADATLLIRLISDRSFGPSRIFFVKALLRTRSPDARATLETFAHDPDLEVEIRHRLNSK